MLDKEPENTERTIVQVVPLVATGAKVANIKVIWPAEMPEQRIDFGLLCADDDSPFMSLYTWESMRPESVDSHYVQKPVANHFSQYEEVTITELDKSGRSRSYSIELKQA